MPIAPTWIIQVQKTGPERRTVGEVFLEVIFWGRSIFNGIYSMLLHLFTAGVLLAATSTLYALTAPGASKVVAMLAAPAVRFKREYSIGARAICLIRDGAFAFNHAFSTLFRAPFSFGAEGPWRRMARTSSIETHLGSGGFSPYRR